MITGNSFLKSMKTFAVLCVLFFCWGCASDSDKGQWDEFWKDLRGDNMKMRTGCSLKQLEEETSKAPAGSK